ncbi:MAG: hypothetical protein KBI32_11050 [Phycisphaerae bacterium]|nr:hypothetical protein [Phycisphaerae bacterium]HON92914.1 hypothetical protein [Sedimentisphaerales bacterium]
MSVLVLPAIILATAVVILSGLWVTIALVRAVRRVDRPGAVPSTEPAHKNSP